MADKKSLESRAEQVLSIIRRRGLEVVNPFFRVCDPEIRQAYLYGLTEEIFTEKDVQEAQAVYQSRELTRRALSSVDSSDSYRQRLINRINNGGGWSSDADARRELERYGETRRKDIDEGIW
ncbi:hypothetical protein K8R33_05095 [archaeon]|nr:hypothetical protein [archaeon]